MRTLASAVLFLLLTSGLASAQCAMCAASADAANSEGKQAMKRAVTMLILPPLAIMGGFVAYAVKRNRE